jgi:hypothetical protein
MAPCKAILKVRKCLCEGTTAFYFEKPHGFEFRAGQFVNLTLLDNAKTDLQGSTRSLSIANAPHEKDLMVAMRNREIGTPDSRGLFMLYRLAARFCFRVLLETSLYIATPRGQPCFLPVA